MSNSRIVPAYVQEKAVEADGFFSSPWKMYFSQQQQYIQTYLGNEGYKVPIVSSDPTSVTPNATGGQVAQLEAAYQGNLSITSGILQNNSPTIGTLIFDPYEINGGSSSNRLGQLKIMLNDGRFRGITNT